MPTPHPTQSTTWLAWVRQTPNRALRAASEAAQALGAIREDYRAYEWPGQSVHWYLEEEFRRCERTVRVRLIEFRMSRALIGWATDAEGRDTLQRLREVEASLALGPVGPILPPPTAETTTNSPPSPRLTFEKTGLVPRSIPRTLDRVRRELLPGTETMVVQEFRVSRYQTLASVRFLTGLVCGPWLVAWLIRAWLLQPATTAFWNASQPELFLHRGQEERAFGEMQAFQEKVYFEVLVGDAPDPSPGAVQARLDAKAQALAEAYNQTSIDAITNLLSDAVALGTFTLAISFAKPQIAVLKSFLDELVYSLSDATKAFLIILCTDIFVGFHSPHGWEVLVELLLAHLGLPESKEFIFLFVATFPVVLDTVLKYWIFRYLNQISPSAVATYHTMNE